MPGKRNDDPSATDDNGTDNPLTHDIGDDKGVDNPLTHDIGDDHGRHHLSLFVNARTNQLIFSDDSVEIEDWGRDSHKLKLDTPAMAPAAAATTVPVWRFHDSASDVYYWTADDSVKDSLVKHHPEVEFQGAAFHAFRDQASGGQTAIGVVWDHGAGGRYGSFTYAPVDDAVRLAGQSDSDALEFMGIAFWI